MLIMQMPAATATTASTITSHPSDTGQRINQESYSSAIAPAYGYGACEPGYSCVCQLYQPVQSQLLWTPIIITNSPFGGSASASTTNTVQNTFADQIGAGAVTQVQSTTVSDNSWSLSATNGATDGLFELDTWTTYSTENVNFLPYGTGTYDPCTTNYGTEITGHTGDLLKYQLQGDATCGCNIPYSFSATDLVSGSPYDGQTFSSVGWLDTWSYQHYNAGVSNCNSGNLQNSVTNTDFTSTTIGVSLTGSLSGTTISLSSVDTVQSGSSTTYTYNYPGNGGAWSFDYLNGHVHGEYAFDWSACPPPPGGGGGGGGGGGCVAFGTMILTPDGYKPVQYLVPGQTVSEYNFTNGKIVNGTLISAYTTDVSEVLSINNGAIVLTPTDQPILAETSNSLGWVVNPDSLTVGDKLFSPTAQSWIYVTSVTLVHQWTMVFDVQTSGPHNYIANGFLPDKKVPGG
jgi:hypothetical protein